MLKDVMKIDQTGSINQRGILRMAADNGHINIIKYMVSLGSISEGESLYAAARAGDLETIEVNINKILTLDRERLLFDAGYSGNMELIKFIIEKVPGPLSTFDFEPGLDGAVFGKKTTAINYFVSLGASLDNWDIAESAAFSGNLDIFKFLFQGSPIPDKFIEIGASGGQLEIIKHIISIKPNDHTILNKALKSTAFHGQLDLIQDLIHMGTTNLTEALYQTTQNRDLENRTDIERYLLSQGANAVVI